MDIYNTNDSFDFTKLKLIKPTPVSGGNYFIKCVIDNYSLYIQPPKCKTRQGIVKSSKRFYSDLMFSNENESFIHWMENLENHCQKTIFENRENWFNNELEMHDIENYFTSPLKIFKSGKYYIIRTNVSTVLGKPSLKVYDENENEIDIETISDDTNVMVILEIQGIKCSSKSFQIEIELKQMMILQPTDIFEKCLIKPKQTSLFITENSILEENLKKQNIQTNDANETKDAIESKDVIEAKDAIEAKDSIVTKDAIEAKDSIVNDDNTQNNIEEKSENIQTLENTKTTIQNDENELLEIDFHLEELKDTEPISIKKRDNIYYEMYKEAKKKAKNARDLALSTYLEAKRIKNTYLLEDLEDDEDDEDDEDEDEDEDEDDENYEEEDNEDNEDYENDKDDDKNKNDNEKR